MPRRRYLSIEAGSDEVLSSVSAEASNVYLLSIPHGDPYGRLPGNAFEFACRVIPGRRYSKEATQALIEELIGAGLYLRWEAEDKVVLAFPAHAWVYHQGKALNPGSKPEHPEPPAEIADVLRNGDLEEKGAEERGRTRKNAEERGRTRKNAEERGRMRKNIVRARALSPSPPPSLSPPPLLAACETRPTDALAENPSERSGSTGNTAKGSPKVKTAPEGPQGSTGEKKAMLPPLDERLWTQVWDVVSSIPGWPTDEARARMTAAHLFHEYEGLNHLMEAKKLKAWHLGKPHMKPGIRRWVYWWQRALEIQAETELRRQEGAASGEAMQASLSRRYPDPKALPMRKVLEQIVAWYRAGIHPAEIGAYMRRAGLRWAGDAARRLEELGEEEGDTK